MSRHRPFWAFLLVATLARLWIIGQSDLMKEEAYYWNYSQHQALSYFDHPPMVAWLIRLSCAVGGHSPFFVRLPSVLLFAGTSGLLYALLNRMYNERTALLGVVLLMLVPIFSVYALTISPDTPMLFFWTLGMYAGWRVLHGSLHWWWLIGVACGLGMDSKYPAAIVPLAVFLFCWMRGKRQTWLCWQMWGAAALAIVLFSPVILWNIAHDFASFRFQAVERIGEATGARERLGTWLIQLAVVGPVAFFPLWWTPFWAWKRRADDRVLFLFCTAAPFMLLLLYVSSRRLVQLNWPIPAYVGGVALLTLMVESWSPRKRHAFLIALAFYALLPWILIFGFPTKLNRFDDITRWQEMGDRALAIRAAMPRPRQTFLFGQGYQAGAELAYTTKLPAEVMDNNVLGERGMGFDFWAQPNDYRGWDGLLVSYAQVTSNGGWRERVVVDMERLKRCFEKVDDVEILTLERGGLPLRQYRYYRCYGYKGPSLR